MTKISTKAAGATVSSRDIFYYYDAFDRRVGKTIDYEGNGVIDRSWVFVFDGQNTVMVLQDAHGAGSMQGYRISERISQGPAVDMVMSEETYSGATGPLVGSSIASSNSGTTLWTIGDDQGSIQDAVDNNGVVRRRVSYNSFGQRTSQIDTDPNGQILPSGSPSALDTLFGYTGRDWDSDAQLQNNRARWYDPATARWLSQDPMSFNAGDTNLYRYVGNRPTYATDPSGLQEPILSNPSPSGTPAPRPAFPFDPSMLPQPGIPKGYRPWRGPRGEQSCIGRLVKEAPDPGFQYLHIGFTYSDPDRDWAPWYGRAYTDTFANKTININVNNPDWNKAIAELQKLGKFNVAVVVGHGAPNQAGPIYAHDIDNARTDSQNGSYRFLEELGKHLQGNKEVWLRTCNSGEDRFFLMHIARIVNGAVYGNTGTWAGIPWGDGRKAEAKPGYAPGSSSLDDDTWWPWPFE